MIDLDLWMKDAAFDIELHRKMPDHALLGDPLFSVRCLALINELKAANAKLSRYEQIMKEVRRLWCNDFGDSMVDVLGLEDAKGEKE